MSILETTREKGAFEYGYELTLANWSIDMPCTESTRRPDARSNEPVC